jgi:hypothetical protein
MLKLQILSPQFEDLKRGDDETIDAFSSKLKDTANQVFQLGKRYSKEMLVCKTLCLLLSRFEAKIVAIAECKVM